MVVDVTIPTLSKRPTCWSELLPFLMTHTQVMGWRRWLDKLLSTTPTDAYVSRNKHQGKGESLTGLVLHGMSGGGTEGMALVVDTKPVLDAWPVGREILCEINPLPTGMSLAATSRR